MIIKIKKNYGLIEQEVDPLKCKVKEVVCYKDIDEWYAIDIKSGKLITKTNLKSELAKAVNDLADKIEMARSSKAYVIIN